MGSSLFTISPCHSPLAAVFFLVFLIVPSGFSNPDLYADCSTRFSCGEISAGYPFWGGDRSDPCGIPDMELKCQNNTSITEMESVSYRVLETRENEQILKIARADYTNEICQLEFMNTTLNSELFEYVPGYRNLTIFYGCPPLVGQPLFTCNIRGSGNKNGYALWDVYGPGLCYRSVVVPVSVVTWSTDVFNLSFLQISLKEGFEVKWKPDQTACNDCIKSDGACGYDILNNQSICYCRTATNSCFSSTDTVLPNPGLAGRKSKRIIVGIGSAIAAVTVTVTAFWCYCRFTRKRGFWKSNRMGKLLKKRERDEKIEEFIMNYVNDTLMPKRYSYSSIRKITNSFNEKLGQGGFAGVYKGKLPDGRFVAVKMLIKSTDDGEEFINEVASISRTSHVNIVKLLGFCYEGNKRALICEYMPNGSLEKYIWNQNSPHKSSIQLGLTTLYEIATGIARGLEYLHRGCNTRIVHFDIKPHNVLLDEDFCPKISDFGLAKLCKGRESIMSTFGARGTAGYIAPEVFLRNFGGVSYKSDVYSYGMMILEMFGGKSNIDIGSSRAQSSENYFPDSIYKDVEAAKICIGKDMTDEEEETVRKVIIVGLWCIQTKPRDRPSMSKVVEMLEGNLQALEIPQKPCLFSTTTVIDKSSAISSTPFDCSNMDVGDEVASCTSLKSN